MTVEVVEIKHQSKRRCDDVYICTLRSIIRSLMMRTYHVGIWTWNASTATVLYTFGAAKWAVHV